MKPNYWKLAATTVGLGLLYYCFKAIPKRTITFETGAIISGTASTVADVAGKPIEDITE